MYTLRDAQRERLQQNYNLFGKSEERAKVEEEQKKVVDNFLKANPHIGILMRDGRPMYYTYPAGGSYKESRDPRKL